MTIQDDLVKGPRVTGSDWAYVYRDGSRPALMMPVPGERVHPRALSTAVEGRAHKVPSLEVRYVLAGRLWVYGRAHVALWPDGAMRVYRGNVYGGGYPYTFARLVQAHGERTSDGLEAKGVTLGVVHTVPGPHGAPSLPPQERAALGLLFTLASTDPPRGYYPTAAALLDVIGQDPAALRALGIANYMALREGQTSGSAHKNPRVVLEGSTVLLAADIATWARRHAIRQYARRLLADGRTFELATDALGARRNGAALAELRRLARHHSYRLHADVARSVYRFAPAW